MTPYSTDSPERETMPLWLAGLSIGLSLLISYSLATAHVQIPAWVDITSVPLLYGLLYRAFDGWGWRLKALTSIGVLKVPYLGGEWGGYVVSEHEEFAVKHPITVTITQEWTHIRISLKADNSTSFATMAAIFVDAPEGVVLTYEYQNEPNPDSKTTMSIHRGSTRLRLVTVNVLDGEYFTGRGRQNHGHIHLTRRS